MSRCLKLLCFLFALGCPLKAQEEGYTVIQIAGDLIDPNYEFTLIEGLHLVSAKTYHWELARAQDGSKRFTFSAKECIYATRFRVGVFGLNYIDLPTPVCTTLSESDALALAPVATALSDFENFAPTVKHTVVYTPTGSSAYPRTVLVPKPPINPQAIFFNGFTYDFLKYDLTTNKVKTSVVLAPQARMFAVRPGSVDASEVWVGHGGLINQLSVVDLAAGKVLATIPTPSLDPNNSEPTGLVFTNSGATALYTSKFFQPDASGNRGALLLVDAATRKVTSTQLLKSAPEALLMAPDGLTAYLLGGSNITYFDVLSGTADLMAPFGFLSGSVFIHPDGTRIFFDQGQQLGIFNLTTRKITAIKYNLPGNALAASVKMSQDGSSIHVIDGKGNVVVLGTRYSDRLAVFQNSANTTQLLPGPR